MKRHRLIFQRLLLALCATLVTTSVFADGRQDGEDPDDPEYRAEAPERPADMPLAELPTPPDLRLAPPRPRALEAIDRLLHEIAAEDSVVRERASRSLLEAKTDWVSGIARRIDQIAERADRSALDRLLDKSRQKTLDRLRRETDGKVETPDYLDIMLEHADPKAQDWRDLTQILALNRMLSAVGTTEAVREIIRIYVRFGEFIRIDCQKQLTDLGDRSVAGLIETLRHQAPAIGEWAQKRLKLRKKLSPHEAVRTDDRLALADILVALGRNGDPESAQLLISFSGTEDSQVRIAARQGLALLGEAAAWQLRDAYLDTTGRTPPRDWTWKRTARELFTEYDRLRLERVYEIYAKAKKAAQTGDLEVMREGYDKVLALQPNFDRGGEMVEGYRRYAKHVEEASPDKAILALRRALRIDGDEASRKKTESALLLLEAGQLRKKGLIDQRLLKRARALDPANEDEALELQTPGEGVKPWGAQSRYLVAGAITLIALLGASWITISTLRRRGKEEPGAPSRERPPGRSRAVIGPIEAEPTKQEVDLASYDTKQTEDPPASAATTEQRPAKTDQKEKGPA